ncbi:MAG TPA: DUF975 family protein [Candidatus Eisenbergiella merdigallinarum]|uniref:DUF975 family protein n=1 Tax=Candidatus Eisenbergiella merdigallinarum TaxID=2838552 RepID=A0A9D2MSF4_9FIRM|nr:DUF975 family protein [Candidatus Eisenbergiella merdigallinarum]
MNRALLKQDAKDAMRAATPHPALTTLAYLAISIAFSMVICAVSIIFGITGALLGSETVGVFSAFISMILAVVLTLLAATIQFGYYVYCLKVFKHEETGVGELFGYFSLFLKIFGLSLWIALFVWLWSLLCFIPGIIAGLRYSQAFFILAENPEKGIRECVNESKLLMSGRLWEFFVLQLSFIPWLILTAITCGIAGLYVTPYTTVTFAGYYLSLKPPTDSQPGYNSYEGNEQGGYRQ